MVDSAEKPNPADLPEKFTIAELEATFDPNEIAQMRKDDPDLFVEDAPVGDDTAPAVDDTEDQAAIAAAKEAAEGAAKTPEPTEEDRVVLADVPDISDAEARLAKAKTDRVALNQRYDDGEITAAERDEELDKLIADQVAAQSEISRATEVIQSNRQTAEKSWEKSLETFKAAGNDALFGNEHAAGFDKALRSVTADPDNAGLPFSVMIQMAAQQHAVAYQARTGKAVEVKTSTGKTAPRTSQEQRRGPRADPRPDPIDTLSNLNAPGDEMVQESRFVAVDKIADRDPEEAERMLSRMSEEERERYLEVGF